MCVLIPKEKDKKNLKSAIKTKKHEQAQILAIECFSFIFADDSRRDSFIRLTGTNTDDLKNLISQNYFLISILSFMMEHESWLLEFAQDNNLDPQDIPNAYQVISYKEE